MDQPQPPMGDGLLAYYAQALGSTVLISAPFWGHVLYVVNGVAATISLLCGAILGVRSVYHIFRGHIGRNGAK